MVHFLTGMQGGYTKFSCYLRLGDSRNDAAHFRQKHYVRTVFEVRKCNITCEAIVDPTSILMLPLQIKLRLIKQFIKALNRESEAFKYLKFFPKLSVAKIKAGIFAGSQIIKLMGCDIFPDLLSNEEKKAWNSFKAVVDGFLGNH